MKKKLPAHSKYSPSSAHIWMNCPVSLDIIKKLPKEVESEAAAEGTKRHTMIEKYLRGKDGLDAFPVSDEWTTSYKEFLKHSKFEKDLLSLNLYKSLQYISRYLCDIFSRSTIGILYGQTMYTELLLEKTVFMDNVIRGCYGTADVITVVGKTLIIIDWKFGRVSVAPSSLQLMVYGIGAYETIILRDKKGKLRSKKDIPVIDTIVNMIVQPKTNAKPKIYKYRLTELKKNVAAYHKKAARMKNKNRKCSIGEWCEKYARCRPHCTVYINKSRSQVRNLFAKDI